MMMFQLSFCPSKEGYGNHRCKSQLDRGILEVYPQDQKKVHRKNRANFAVSPCLPDFSSSVYSIQV